VTDIKEGDLFGVRSAQTSGLTMFVDVSPYERTNVKSSKITLYCHDVVMFLGYGRNLDTIFLTKLGIAGWNMGRRSDMRKYFYEL
jgi:hypothetical protein